MQPGRGPGRRGELEKECPGQAETPRRTRGHLAARVKSGPTSSRPLPSLPEGGWVPSCSHSQAAPAVILSLCPWPGRRPKAAHQCLLFRAILARRNREAALPARTLRSFLSKSGPHPPFGPAPTAIPPQPGALPGRRDFKGPVPDLPRPRWVRGPQSEARAGSLTSGLPQSQGLREPRGGAGLQAPGLRGGSSEPPEVGGAGRPRGQSGRAGSRGGGRVEGSTGAGGPGAGRGVQAAAAAAVAAAAPQCPAPAPAAAPARDAPLRDPARPFTLGIPPSRRPGLQRTPHHLAGEFDGHGAAGSSSI